MARAALAAGIVFTLPACAAQQKPRQPRVPVTVAVARHQVMPFAISAIGTVEPLQTASVGSQVGGTLRKVLFHEGDVVRQGQPLFALDARPLRATLDRALATVAKDRAEYESARRDAERARKLFEQGMLSQAEWEDKRTAMATWAATVRADSAAGNTARLDFEYASIRAPISGRTGRLMVHEGDYVKAATSDPLVTINQVDPIRVRFTVPGSSVSLVQRYRNQRPRVVVRHSDVDTTSHEGELVFVDNAVDQASGTLLLKGQFKNGSGYLVPGQFVDVRLVLYVDPSALVVPSPAVTNGQQGTYVYVLNPDSTVAPRPVKVERTVDELAIVTDGLKEGETVITDGQLRLAPGSRVIVRTAGGGRSETASGS